MSDTIPSNVLQESDVTGPIKAKIGTFTPTLIWVHTDDTPLTEGEKFRFVTTDPNDKHDKWGSEVKGGVVDAVEDNGVETLYFVTEMTYYDGFMQSEDNA